MWVTLLETSSSMKATHKTARADGIQVLCTSGPVTDWHRGVSRDAPFWLAGRYWRQTHCLYTII